MKERRNGFRVASRGVLAFAALLSLAGSRGLAAQDPVEMQKTLVAIGDFWTYFKGIEEPDPEWFMPTFDDRDWEEGPSAFGYGTEAHEAQALVAGTTLDDMQNNYLSVYIRKVFVVEDIADVAALALNLRYDDGCVVYLNGEEIARLSMGGAAGSPVPFDTTANSHEANTVQPLVFSCEQLALVGTGENVLAIQAHNTALDSSDLIIEPELVALSTICPTELTAEERSNGSVRVQWTRPFARRLRYDSLELRRNGELVEDQPSPTRSTYTDDAPLPGTTTYQLKIGFCDAICETEVQITIGPGEAVFRRGDADDNGGVNVTDALVVLAALFQGTGEPACLDAADTNDDGSFNLTDGIFLLGSLFQGTAQPPAPGAECGVDPTMDELAECTYASCE